MIHLRKVYRLLYFPTASGFRCLSQLALTGFQPTGTLHLGNYLAVIKPCIELVHHGKVSQLLLLIADLHALTSGTNQLKLSHSILQTAATLVACFNSCPPVPPSSSNSSGSQNLLFLQSHVRGHTELAWILASKCTLPGHYTDHPPLPTCVPQRLSHLPQWRDKSSSMPASASVGLFTYPVLQAADILLYGADVVPVGVDQTTHIELTRDLVRAAVSNWPNLDGVLKVPTMLSLGVPKINSLRHPRQKMSKSDTSSMGTIYLTDSADTIKQKVTAAQTDSEPGLHYDIINRPGLSNLLCIYSALTNQSVNQIIENNPSWDKKMLKVQLSDVLIAELAPIRNSVNYLTSTADGREELMDCLRSGSEFANNLAQRNLKSVYSAIGCELPHTDLPHFLDSNENSL